MRKNLEYFGDDVFNALNTAFIFPIFWASIWTAKEVSAMVSLIYERICHNG